MPETLEIRSLFDKSISEQASDLHLNVGYHPVVRIDGSLEFLTAYPILTEKDLEALINPILSANHKEMLINNKNLDFSYQHGAAEESVRIRIHLFYQRGTLAGAFRFLPPKIKSVDDLGLPDICHQFAKLKQGFILVTGPTGHGKSTTLAAIINEINLTRSANIITVEDPIEYIYPKGKSIISQRELGFDTHSWNEPLRSLLREDPDVALVGEMRDPESISSAITIAETGHLVFSTLHTNSAAQSIDRIIDAFPDFQENQIRVQLASTIEGIISQRLVPRIDGGRAIAVEVLLGTNAVKSNVRERKTHLIDSIIETSQEIGMIPLEASLANLVKKGIVTVEVARAFALREKELMRLLS